MGRLLCLLGLWTTPEGRHVSYLDDDQALETWINAHYWTTKETGDKYPSLTPTETNHILDVLDKANKDRARWHHKSKLAAQRLRKLIVLAHRIMPPRIIYRHLGLAPSHIKDMRGIETGSRRLSGALTGSVGTPALPEPPEEGAPVVDPATVSPVTEPKEET
jgi:hypothetical protein